MYWRATFKSDFKSYNDFNVLHNDTFLKANISTAVSIKFVLPIKKPASRNELVTGNDTWLDL